MVVELQPFVIALIDHVGIKLSFSQHVERKRSMKCQSSQVLFPDQIGPVLVSGVRGPRWWKGRNLCLIVRTQFSVLDAHNLLQHGVALPQWKVSSSSSSLQLEVQFSSFSGSA